MGRRVAFEAELRKSESLTLAPNTVENKSVEQPLMQNLLEVIQDILDGIYQTRTVDFMEYASKALILRRFRPQEPMISLNLIARK